MSTTEKTAFSPYKIINQGRSTLQLEPGKGAKASVVVLRIIPLFLFVIGVIVFLVQKETFYLLIFGGIALFEVFVFSFIKIPAAVSMDSMGFTLETLSIKGRKENYYLWSDVDYIRQRMIVAKNSTTLNYAAVLNTGKKINFLSFNNYYSKKQSIPEINNALHDVSKKEVREK
ncbi:MAG: hypothetical protein EON98_02560 [Chitinophagaceae bacterium]|nr:MAG: hypothetical protein EON98_02560 [Chitinophagaceae bacterium]